MPSGLLLSAAYTLALLSPTPAFPTYAQPHGQRTSPPRPEAKSTPDIPLFSDVPRENGSYARLHDLQQKGIVRGYPEGFFSGKRPLTRYEFALAIERLTAKMNTLTLAQDGKTLQPASGIPNPPAIEPGQHDTALRSAVGGSAPIPAVAQAQEILALCIEFQLELQQIGCNPDALQHVRKTLKIYVAANIVSEKVVQSAQAQVFGAQPFDFDFTHPETLKGRVEAFPEELKFSDKGLGYDAGVSRSLQVHFQTEPIALGYAWTPTSGVAIYAGLNVDFADIGAYSLGQLYVRYSPDAMHWSTWQNLAGSDRVDRSALRHTYKGQVVVPDVERVPYFALLRQFYKAQPEQVGDEGAAVRWIVKKDPRYFEKTLPFIGYLQFLFETPLNGGQHIKSLHLDLGWTVPGLHMVSKREREAEKNKVFLPWNYRAASTRTRRP